MEGKTSECLSERIKLESQKVNLNGRKYQCHSRGVSNLLVTGILIVKLFNFRDKISQKI